MIDIDWLAVQMVCDGATIHHLTKAERAMVIRRLSDRMRSNASRYCTGLTSDDLALRLGVSIREIDRGKAELPEAQQRQCPVCHEPMWVIAGRVEAHPDRLFNECLMSGRYVRSGLAAERPDLYLWLEEASA